MNHTSQQSTKRVPIYGLHPVTKERGHIRAYALVDAEDYERVMGYRWRLSTMGYARANVVHDEKERCLFMHRLVMGNLESRTDHINRNPLDNRSSNLRPATQHQNNGNRSLESTNTSGYRGVSWNKAASKWRAYITNNNKQNHLGLFASKEDAARAYDSAAVEVFGEFANLNL